MPSPLDFILRLLLWLPFTFVLADDSGAVQYSKDGRPDDPGLAAYVSRPDLRVPKWNLTIHERALNSPGYWFVAPYRGVNGEQANESWIGPCIYDGRNGELVWSGNLMVSSNVEDFRISNVNGVPLMTFFAHDEVVVLNNDYSVRAEMQLETQGNLNTHELNFVENGTQAIILRNELQTVTAADAKTFMKTDGDKDCVAKYDGFSVLDATKDDWPEIFRWSSFGRIGLEESTFIHSTTESRCRGWDFIHANSVDQTPEGDYLYSARHTNTIYKISGVDGSILWRLGGKKSSFTSPENLLFSRQHDVRYRGQNDTHFFISMLDNAKGQDDQPKTHNFTRGLLIAIDEKNMRAAVEVQYAHPYHERGPLAPRRGNLQRLSNGNVLIGWSERAMQSEHTPDGKLIWEAILQIDWMGSYRNYKFDGFVARPYETPAAVCRTYSDNRGTMTVVYVSWNGATEVVKWNMYKTSRDDETDRILVATAAKVGFETALSFAGYAEFLVVEAIDRHGNRIGSTSVIDNTESATISPDGGSEEDQWLQDLEIGKSKAAKSSSKVFAAFSTGAVCGAFVLLLLVRYTRQHITGVLRWSFVQSPKYSPIPQ